MIHSPDRTEGDTKPAIKRQFAACGCVVVPTPVLRRVLGIQGAPPGWPDLVVLVPPGRVLLVELKRPKGGRYTPAQVAMHALLRRCGFGEHLVTVTTTAEAVQAVNEARKA